MGSNPILSKNYNGDIVQLVERVLCKHFVIGSSPVISSFFLYVVKVVKYNRPSSKKQKKLKIRINCDKKSGGKKIIIKKQVIKYQIFLDQKIDDNDKIFNLIKKRSIKGV